MRARVLLFDIDGTLVDCAGAGRRAMELAFEARTGRTDVLGFPFGGMTDRAIARGGLEAAGREASAAEIDALLSSYVEHLGPSLDRTSGFRVLPGVAALLDALSNASGRLAIGLGTGNVEVGAGLKLARGGLHGRFSFGGFGSDAEARDALLEAGARRGAERLGRRRDEVEVIVVGDTPKDVAAGKAIGARIVAVGTGRVDLGTLRAAGADHVLHDLSGADALELLRLPA